MADITAQMVKELRESTGAGMMDCKAALTETKGDMTAAHNVGEEVGLPGRVDGWIAKAKELTAE